MIPICILAILAILFFMYCQGNMAPQSQRYTPRRDIVEYDEVVGVVQFKGGSPSQHGHEYTVKKDTYEGIKNGKITATLRLKKGGFKTLEKDDEITWVNREDENDKIKFRVHKLTEYPSLSEAFSKLDKSELDKIYDKGNNKLTKNDLIELYNKFYDEKAQKKFPAIYIEFKKL